MINYVYYSNRAQINITRLRPKTKLIMLYDTYGEEYLIFLRELNEILSVNQLAEVDYM